MTGLIVMGSPQSWTTWTSTMGSLVHDAKAAEYQEWLEEKNLDQNES
jgi:hypothetical protein